MSQHRTAVAVFVKTPGLSPIKTRLAAGIGAEAAAEFYALSVTAVEHTVTQAVSLCGNLSPYWAVAEQAGLADPRWRRFERLHQGAGHLGDRLARAFGELRPNYDSVIAIGADSPQITPELIGDAVELLITERDCPAHVMGRCHDGGFYLVGTSGRLPREIWLDVPYSTPHAADCLAAKLCELGTLHQLPPLSDVDVADDLHVLRRELDAIAEPSAEQITLKALVCRLSLPTSRSNEIL